MNSNYINKLEKLNQVLEEADFIVIGGAAGMSAAGGPSFYEADESYLRVFGKFEEVYKSGSIMNLFYKRNWDSRGHYWAFLVTMMHWILNEDIFIRIKI